MINFKNTNFVKSAPSYMEAPELKKDEVLIIGRSNVGKSSLINALCSNKSLAFISSKPGHTKLLNFYNVDDRFYLVDAPGYGYSISSSHEVEFFGDLMEGYFSNSKKLKTVIFLLDSRRKLNKDDIDIYNYLKEEGINFLIVLTKCDKINQKEKHQILTEIKNISPDKPILTSTLNKNGLDELKGAIEKSLL